MNDDDRVWMEYGVEYPTPPGTYCTFCCRLGDATRRDDCVTIKHPWRNRALGQLLVRCPRHLDYHRRQTG
jgi:hypothetical protein